MLWKLFHTSAHPPWTKQGSPSIASTPATGARLPLVKIAKGPTRWGEPEGNRGGSKSWKGTVWAHSNRPFPVDNGQELEVVAKQRSPPLQVAAMRKHERAAAEQEGEGRRGLQT